MAISGQTIIDKEILSKAGERSREEVWNAEGAHTHWTIKGVLPPGSALERGNRMLIA